ncbi:MAG: enoyl-CoA hydratase/isomerase family protein [Dehalococcoidia bacterium]|nr:enoyl-CoA hydratase/isomerase family protein [Dehalococcoidia bacterium]
MTTEQDVDTSSWKQTPDGIPIPPPSPEDVLYENRDGVGWITLNRPRVLNAVNKNVTRLLAAALDQAAADEDAKAVILIGAGRAFCAGGDMWSSLYPDDQPAPEAAEVQGKIWSMPKPVIAAVRGHALGQGAQFVNVCDFTVASDTARIGEIQIRQGFFPPTLISPYLMGIKHAKEFMLLGDAFTAEDAYRIGIVNRVVPDAELEAAAEAMAKKLAALPATAVRLNKLLVNRVYELAGFQQGFDWRKDYALRTLSEQKDEVAEARVRIREEQGWAAFKEERNKGYQD